jgi:hypothetical protein
MLPQRRRDRNQNRLHFFSVVGGRAWGELMVIFGSAQMSKWRQWSR